MITYVVGDLFQSPAKVLVNTVNTVGVMGSGIAKDFKHIYPDMFKQYQQFCEQGQFNVGQLWIYKTPHKWILNFLTKAHWRQKSRPEYIEQGLQKFVATYAEKGITSISFPRLGCGNGELDWAKELAARISQAFGKEVGALELNRENLARVLDKAEILVNTTSVGMSPNIGETPLDATRLRPGLVVYDIVYNPVRTRLLKEAEAAGAETIEGLDMLVWQGALAFERWTGQRAPVELMKKEALRLLGEHEN